MQYQVKLEAFEGPFDLLFHLIEKNEVDIYDIPIAEITRQYLDHLEGMKHLDLETVSEFLVLAATLLSIKARMLLPKPARGGSEETGEDEVDPRDELVERLLEYKKFKNSALHLGSLQEQQGRTFYRLNEPESFFGLWQPDDPLQGLTLQDLVQALQQVLANLDLEEPVREIPREAVTINGMMAEMEERLRQDPQGISFQQLFAGARRRIDVVVRFLALLELVRLQRIRVRQREICGEILIFAQQSAQTPAEGEKS